jgi:thiol-disulfide isomerase/thioredoxin
MNRRQMALGAGVGAVAAAAGVVGWRLTAERSEPAPAGFWDLTFERPEGGELALSSLRGGPLLVNFWATWCAPCITELPLLDAFAKEQAAAGWKLVGLAIDAPTPVRRFVKERPLSFPVGLAGLEGTELGRLLGNAQGGLPFSVVFDRQGRIGARKLGALHAPDLERWAKQF